MFSSAITLSRHHTIRVVSVSTVVVRFTGNQLTLTGGFGWSSPVFLVKLYLAQSKMRRVLLGRVETSVG